MTRVVAPSRLHFGLLNVGAVGVGLRPFGGAGLMIQDPGVIVQVKGANEWSACGPLADRALAFAQSANTQIPEGLRRPVQVTVEQCPPEHVGLGVGTQLGLAVVTAMTHELGLTDLPLLARARLAGRGHRSGIGVHGFDAGGFLLDGGRGRDAVVAPLVARYEFPRSWRIVLARPQASGLAWADNRERAAFARPRQAQVTIPLTDRMARLLVLGILPALLESDIDSFGESLHEYNQLAGRMFAEDQGGDYASPEVEGLVQTLRDLGISGVGQSSWGPTVFAMCESPEQAGWLVNQVTLACPAIDICITESQQTGAKVEQEN